jgi:hypothetical protein
MPIHNEFETPKRARETCREQREVRERCRVNDVVPPPVPEQVPQDAEPEHEWRPYTPPTSDIELHSRTDRDHADITDSSLFSVIPLAEGQVRHVMAVRSKPLREVAVPALGTPDGMGV